MKKYDFLKFLFIVWRTSFIFFKFVKKSAVTGNKTWISWFLRSAAYFWREKLQNWKSGNYGTVECGWRRCWRVYLEHINPLRWAASIIPPSIWNSAKASSTLKKHRITSFYLKTQNYYTHIIMVVNKLLQENMK